MNKPKDYYSVALIGSSGGGTATLGHTNPIQLLTTIHNELLNICDGDGNKEVVCIGLSHAIFVSLIDGGGFDSIRSEDDWLPDDDNDKGPMVSL